MFGPSTVDFQLTVLQHLANHDDVPGRELRAHVETALNCRLGPGFYLRMAAMEDDGYVVSSIKTKIVNKMEIEETRYTINREIGPKRIDEIYELKERMGPGGSIDPLGGLLPG